MYQVVWQENESIEVGIDDKLTVDEFKQVIHQLESLCAANPKIKVLFDLSHMTKYELKVEIEEYKFYKEYKHCLERVAVVSDRRSYELLTKVFAKFTDVDIRHYPVAEIDEARQWTFPSRLP